MDNRGIVFRFQAGRKKFFFSPKHLVGIWGPPKLLFCGYRDSFLQDKAAGA